MNPILDVRLHSLSRKPHTDYSRFSSKCWSVGSVRDILSLSLASIPSLHSRTHVSAHLISSRYLSRVALHCFLGAVDVARERSETDSRVNPSKSNKWRSPVITQHSHAEGFLSLLSSTKVAGRGLRLGAVQRGLVWSGLVFGACKLEGLLISLLGCDNSFLMSSLGY
jgi:hypothetical protein